jgi:hypothetical protein
MTASIARGIVGAVRTQVMLALGAAYCLSSCGSDEAAFLPLSELCGAYAEEVCAGREDCCEGVDTGTCERDVRASCEESRAILVTEADLSYDGVYANDRRSDLQIDMLDCKPAFSVARFFRGGLKRGEACESDGQCRSLRCSAPDEEESVCAAEQALALCEPADI